MATDEDQEAGFDPKRRLCPDGSCIGVLGSDGKCTVCGTPDSGDPGAEPEAPSPRQSDAVLHDDDVEIAHGGHDEPGPAFDPDRRLCSDGTCVGIIGEHNRCSVCGKPAE
jgi:hypothetical protein